MLNDKSMKKIILYMTLCLIGMVQVACDQDIDGFDNSTIIYTSIYPFNWINMEEKQLKE